MALITLPTAALCWNTEGHQVIAIIAESHLTPSAKAGVDKLLAQEPGENLVSISTWADKVKGPVTIRWHFVSFPHGTCDYVPERDCPDGACVVAALKNKIQELSQGPKENRLKALKYVVNLVGDIHEPLNAGFVDDHHGSDYPVQIFGRTTNLHEAWGSLMKPTGANPRQYARRIEPTPAASVSAGPIDPAAWARESCRIKDDSGPHRTLRFYPDNGEIGTEYISVWQPTLQDRLEFAGVRLAAVLNEAF